MYSFTVSILFVALAAANAGLIAGGIAASPIDSAAIITGPSGQVVRSGITGYAAPLLANPLLFGAPTLAAGSLAVAAPNARIAPAGLIVPAGHGLEGQWIPEISEKLYDDGSYKPQIYGF